jgi:tetratricopeptide (TPR) repeat protein
VAGDGPLPDPKEKLGTLADLKAGFEHMGRKDFAGAVAAFRKVLAENPKMVDAWEFLARGLQRLGRSEEALAAYREALKISAGAPHIAVSAASLYFDLGRFEDAEAHAKMALATNASFAHGLLAQIALQRKQLDVAEREARAAMEDQSQRVGPLVTLAEVLHAKRDFSGALDSLQKAQEAYDRREAKDQDLLQGLELIRGKVLADQGDAAGAEAAFRKEIERFPEGVRAYSSLAILYALAGKPEAVGPTLKAMVDGNPTPFAYAEAVKTLRILKDEASAAQLLRMARGRFPESTALKGLDGRG